MPVFKYKAMNENGRIMRGSITAANDLDLEEKLQDLGFDLIDYREEDNSAGKAKGKKVKINDLIIMCVHLEQLDRAGVPLLEALSDVRDSSESQVLKDAITDIYEDVRSGEMISTAMKKHPKIFDAVFIGVVASGEQTGNLSETWRHMEHHLKWTDKIRRKIRKALSYPAMMLFMMVAVITVLMVLVVPQLIDFLKAQSFDIPFHTRALIATSNFMVDYWYLIFGIPIAAAVTIYISYKKSPAFAYNFDLFMLHLPIIGQTIRKINLARFSHFFEVLFQGGIGILDCFDASSQVVHNKVLKEAVLVARKSLSEGHALADSLRISGQFPNLVIKMFRVGEESGNMSDAMKNINFFYDREVEDSVEKMISAIQPTLTLVMGVIVMWVAASVFGPLYDSFGQMDF